MASLDKFRSVLQVGASVALHMKRVLLVTDYFRPDPGGLEALFTGVARAWQAGALEVIANRVSRQSRSTPSDLAAFDKGEDYKIIRPDYSQSWQESLKFKARMQELLEQRLTLFGPEHVLFGDLHRATRVSVPVLKTHQIPYSIFLNGNDLKNRLGFLHRASRRIVMEAENVFTLSRYLAREARGYGIAEDRITVLPPFFESRWPRRSTNRLPQFLQKRINKKILLLSLGPFVPRKGQDILIESFARLQDLHHETHLLLAGSGPEFPFLQELIRLHHLDEHVSLTGFLDDATLAGVWKRADIYVQPGRDREDDVESLGMVFLEAAWFGVPMLAGRVGGVDEIVRHGVSGFVIEPGNRDDLSDKLRQMIVSDQLRLRFGKNARDIARRDLDPDRICAFIHTRL
ncbi:MAG: glycosyltransferase family 4 protein [Leptospiraceae bacterium]|nr:glycosyltransferase family 4 protein [Leptospiraceae bacterium]